MDILIDNVGLKVFTEHLKKMYHLRFELQQYEKYFTIILSHATFNISDIMTRHLQCWMTNLDNIESMQILTMS